MSCVEFRKIWEDDGNDLFELSVTVHSADCRFKLNIYTSNQELEVLRNGMQSVGTSGVEQFIWTSGEDTDDISHYLYFRFFLCSKRGHVAIEVLADNKAKPPYGARANFYMITELGSVDGFAKEIERLVQGKESIATGIIASSF